MIWNPIRHSTKRRINSSTVSVDILNRRNNCSRNIHVWCFLTQKKIHLQPGKCRGWLHHTRYWIVMNCPLITYLWILASRKAGENSLFLMNALQIIPTFLLVTSGFIAVYASNHVFYYFFKQFLTGKTDSCSSLYPVMKVFFDRTWKNETKTIFFFFLHKLFVLSISVNTTRDLLQILVSYLLGKGLGREGFFRSEHEVPIVAVTPSWCNIHVWSMSIYVH